MGGGFEQCDASGRCELIDYAKNFDGWSTWVAGWYTPIKEPPTENYTRFLEEGYSVWNRLAKKYNRQFIPSIVPGYINVRKPKDPVLPRSTTMFEKIVEIALEYANSVDNKILIRIDTFNEFSEGTVVEPVVEENSIYLCSLFKILKKYLEKP